MYRYICQQVSILYVVLLVLTAPCAWPQAGTGTLNGTVRDQSGAVIPSALVSLTKTDTNELSKTSTNSAGFYEFPGLVPGSYLLRVESRGMETFEGRLNLEVEERAVVDVALTVGKTTAVVTVQDVTPQVQTDNGTVNYTLEQTRIQQLPINGRTVLTLLETIPGMEGQRSFGIEDHSYSFMLDGADIADRDGWNPITQRQPGLDSIQEFAVVENGESAKYARPTTIVATTKGGSNKLHGNAFETIRNNDLMYARTRTTYSAAPYLNRNEFGANAGGPVYIPKLYNGTDKTFWWFGYEALRQVSPPVNGYPTPTQAWRQGNLAGDIDVNGIPYTIYDPYTTNTTTWARTAYTNNVITEPISPLAKYLLSEQPLPTLPNVNPNIADNYFGPVPSWTRNYTVSARVDQKFGDRDAVYGRYTRGAYTSLSGFQSQPTMDWNKIPSGTQGYNSPNHSVALSWVHTFSPTLFNELLASGSWVPMFDGTGNLSTNYDAQLGLPNPFGVGGWPGIYNAGFPNVGHNLEWETQNTNAYHMAYAVIDDNATKVRGKHEFQFGFHFRDDQLDVLPAQQQVAGNDNFLTDGTSLYNPATSPTNPQPLPYTGDNFANFYLGDANYSNQLVRGLFYARQKEFAGYFQDNWKLTPRLTVNLGLRYEYWTPFTEKNNMVESFDPTYNQGVISSGLDTTPPTPGLLNQGALVLASSPAKMETFGYTTPSIIAKEQALQMTFENPAQAGMPGVLETSNKHDFAPRLGFAYRLTGGSKPFVLRGGYALSYFHIQLQNWVARMRLNTPSDIRYWYSVSQAAYSPDGIANYGLRSVPTVVAGQNSTSSIVSLTNAAAINPGSGSVDYFALNQPDPRVHTWNLTVQKEIPWKIVVSASYVGNHSFGNEMLYNYNNSTPAYIWYLTTGQPLPTGAYSGTATNYFNQTSFGSTIEEWLQTGWGNSNGGDVQVKRTFQGGSTFEFFYTLDNNFGAGGNGYSASGASGAGYSTNSQIPAPNQFLPGTIPVMNTVPTTFTSKLAALEREYDYQRDTSIPKHRYEWNWLQDLPVGHGKRFLGGARPLLDKFVGGWQIAGIGTAYSTYYQLPSSDFPTGTPVQEYGYKYKIQNCTSGTCYPGYLFYNGYISPQLINQPNGYEGIPANYKPAFTPLIPYGATSAPNMPAGTNISSFWNTNTAWVPLNNGTVQQTTWAGFSPLWQQYIPGNRQWNVDASLIKNIPFKEGRLNLRLECDFFNVFNHPGNPAPGSSGGLASDGTLSEQYSSNSPRTLQLVGRISW